jgi:predicted enzyme related to lactoylglutathione lyase
MPEASSYAPGTPSWVDLYTSDPEGARAFYGQLFGWEFDIGPEEAGFYTICRVRGLSVARLGQAMQEGMPTVWTTYIATDDVEATMQRVVEAGGEALMGPIDVMDQGRLAIASDVTGAVFGIWQAGKHTGAQLVNEPGGWIWNELYTRDLAAAQEFYTKVFGYGWEAFGTGDGGPAYQLLKVGENTVGGAMQIPADSPAGIPPHWMTYFAVEDTDTVIAAAERLGGTVEALAFDTPVGRIAVLRDPQSGVFSVIQPHPPQ